MIKIFARVKGKLFRNGMTSRVAGALLYSFLGAGVSKVCVFVSGILISRVLGQESYGQYSLILSTINTFVTFASAGIGASVFRYTSAYRNQDQERCGHYIGGLTLICVVMSVIMSALIVVFSEPIARTVSDKVDLSIYLRNAGIIILFIAIGTVMQNILLGFEKYKLIAIIDIAYGVVELIAGTVMSIAYGLNGTIIGLLIARLVFVSLSSVLTASHLRRSSIKVSFRLNKEISTAFANMAVPSFLAGLLVLPVSWFLNIQLVNVSGFAEMAVYSVSTQWVAIITYMMSQFCKVKPIYTSLYSEGKIAELTHLVNKMTIVSSAIGGVMAVVAIVFSKYIMSFYGNDYVPYANVFRIMMMAVLLISLQSQLGSVFEATGHMWTGFSLNMVWAINIITFFMLLKGKGALGYSIAYFLSYFVHVILSWIGLNIVLRKERRN